MTSAESAFRACVFGNPIVQSKSPQIHRHFAQQFAIELDYQKQAPELDKFEQALKDFFADQRSIGANVTLPFKERALRWADELSSHAKRAGAVNTLIRTASGIVGENTDGKGLVKDFAFHNVILEGQSILLLGAGGAAKGALPALIDAGPSKLCVYNRTQDKAQDLVSSACAYTDMSVEVFDTANAQSAFDVIINATSLSMRNETPDIPESVFSANTVAYDMVYRDEATAFMKMAAAAGSAKQLDGLGMLIEQAALSFSHWFSKVPDTKILRTQLRK